MLAWVDGRIDADRDQLIDQATVLVGALAAAATPHPT
jgi:hypothetical protein